ncbi:MAG: nucleotide exchange factor GrpE [Clostridia bacterium]|nr:nucleotide exchange factor GrpE [Clostridia bacterium]
MSEENKDINTEDVCDASSEETDVNCEESTLKKQSKSSKDKKLKAELEALKAKLAEAEAKNASDAAEAADKYARLAAEYDNFRRRSQKEKEAVYGDAVAATVMGIVPIIDNLMYAEKFGGGEDNPEKFAEGVKLILGKVPETLEKMNVSVFGTPGETFDPNLHNAVMHVEDDSYGEGEIVDVLQCGYKYGDKVIRYAMVRVAN